MALDIGDKRIGVAIADQSGLIARPLVTIENGTNILDELKVLIDLNHVSQLVIGLPRGLDGQSTAQTEKVRQMANDIAISLGLKVIFQDEALTSVKAKEELRSGGKVYAKSDVDKLAACYILEDYIKENF